MIDVTEISGDIENSELEGNIVDANIAGNIDFNNISGILDVIDEVEADIDYASVEGDVAPTPSVINEIDPTVPSWAKQPEKPEYTWDEILDRPSINTIILEGNKQLEDLDINSLTNQQILEAWNRI